MVSRADVEFWDAVNEFAAGTRLSIKRQKAVARIESIRREERAQIRREVVEAIVERAASSSHLHDEILLIQEFVRFWLAEQKASE